MRILLSTVALFVVVTLPARGQEKQLEIGRLEVGQIGKLPPNPNGVWKVAKVFGDKEMAVRGIVFDRGVSSVGRPFIIRGIVTSKYADDSIFETKETFKVLAPKKLASGASLFVLEVYQPNPIAEDKK